MEDGEIMKENILMSTSHFHIYLHNKEHLCAGVYETKAILRYILEHGSSLSNIPTVGTNYLPTGSHLGYQTTLVS